MAVYGNKWKIIKRGISDFYMQPFAVSEIHKISYGRNRLQFPNVQVKFDIAIIKIVFGNRFSRSGSGQEPLRLPFFISAFISEASSSRCL